VCVLVRSSVVGMGNHLLVAPRSGRRWVIAWTGAVCEGARASWAPQPSSPPAPARSP
jgi:hypothetical protein